MQTSPENIAALREIAKALSEIAKAQNRPSAPPWVIPFVFTLLGAIISVVVQQLNVRLLEMRQKKQLRRDLYKEVESAYLNIRFLLTTNVFGDDFKKALAWRKKRAAESIPFDAEEHANRRRELYVALTEYQTFKQIYLLLHGVIEAQEDDFGGMGIIFVSHMNGVVGRCELPSKYINRFMSAQFRALVGKQLDLETKAIDLDRS